MCLAIPGSIVAIEGTNATIDMLGVQRRISISLTPQAQVGDYVLVHAGFAIEVIDADPSNSCASLMSSPKRTSPALRHPHDGA